MNRTYVVELYAQLGIPIENLDIKDVFVQEAFRFGDTDYVKEHYHGEGSISHGKTVAILLGK